MATQGKPANRQGPQYQLTGQIGVFAVGRIFTEGLGWIFRQQDSADTGIDAHVEVVKDGVATGQLLALQIKSGTSYVSRRTSKGFTYYGEMKHLEYWIRHALPVVLVLYDPVNEKAYWQHIRRESVRRTKNAWRTVVDQNRVLAPTAKNELDAVSETNEIRISRVLGVLLESGSNPDALAQHEFLVEYDDIAEELRGHLKLLARIQPAGQLIDGLIRQRVLRRSREPEVVAEFSDYAVVSLVGRGGMGIVFRAFENSLTREVALKLLSPELVGHESSMAAFGREACAAAASCHQCVVSIYRFDQDRGWPYMAMEYVPSVPLGKILQGGPLPASTTQDILKQLLNALIAVHDAEWTHCDIKPSNILLKEPGEELKLIDFGLARPLRKEPAEETSNVKEGTLAYMSPEQLRGVDYIDQRTDLYAAGVVCYEMLTGERPFDGDGKREVVKRILRGKPAHPKSLNVRADTRLSGIALRLMARVGKDRYRTAREALAELA